MNLFAVFLTGLTTGGLSCLAMQGGLLAGVVSNHKKQELHEDDLESSGKQVLTKPSDVSQRLERLLNSDLLPVAMFVIAKIVTHAVFGFVLGGVGSAITLSVTVRLIFQVFTALFMFATAMNLLDVHPVFRYVLFQPPRFVRRLINDASKSQAIFSPALLGSLTIFIPCGVTQAMMVLAMNTANPVMGALLLTAFTLGTAPIFTLLGLITVKLSEIWSNLFSKVAALALIAMALYSINGVLIVLDSPLAFYNLSSGNQVGALVELDQDDNQLQRVTLNVEYYGYEPEQFVVQQGVPVELTLVSDNVYTCALDFVFKKFSLHIPLKPTDKQTVTFTPQEKGQFVFACSMGMHTGVMEVI